MQIGQMNFFRLVTMVLGEPRAIHRETGKGKRKISSCRFVSDEHNDESEAVLLS